MNDGLLEEFKSLWDQAEAIRDSNHKAQGFSNYVAADYRQVLNALIEHC
jgi:O-succinylbenzoate synthase